MLITDLTRSIYSARLDGSDRKLLLTAPGELTGVACAEINTRED